MKPKDYKAIELWGQNMGSYSYYIEAQQLQAAIDNAPADAIYHIQGPAGEYTGQWRTIRDLFPEHTVRRAYEALTKEPPAAA